MRGIVIIIKKKKKSGRIFLEAPHLWKITRKLSSKCLIWRMTRTNLARKQLKATYCQMLFSSCDCSTNAYCISDLPNWGSLFFLQLNPQRWHQRFAACFSNTLVFGPDRVGYRSVGWLLYMANGLQKLPVHRDCIWI